MGLVAIFPFPRAQFNPPCWMRSFLDWLHRHWCQSGSVPSCPWNTFSVGGNAKQPCGTRACILVISLVNLRCPFAFFLSLGAVKVGENAGARNPEATGSFQTPMSVPVSPHFNALLNVCETAVRESPSLEAQKSSAPITGMSILRLNSQEKPKKASCHVFSVCCPKLDTNESCLTPDKKAPSTPTA